MNQTIRAQDIVHKALSLGYAGCGIIRLTDMAGYGNALDRRVERFPETGGWLGQFRMYAEPEKHYPWARSIIVCTRWYGKYRIPENLHGLIAKYYLADSRKNEMSPDHRDSVHFEGWLGEQGLRTACARDFSLTAVRWAAMRAGIGVIRKNNFLYTERGSWVHLEAWLIDQELEYTHAPSITPCPDNCSLCIRACPTGSLAAPFAMHCFSCISYMTTWDECRPDRPGNDLTGSWVYGCDACQDACPHNRNAWSSGETFPGLDALSHLSPEYILSMDDDAIRAELSPRFWYISKKHVWKWKGNALNAIRNRYEDRYKACVEAARRDSHENVRAMADWVASTTGG